MAVKYPAVEWSYHSNVYEVNIRQYTPEGTFKAFQQHLPRLKKMGVEILWLMPVTPISQIKKKGSLGSYYACSSYTAINPEFGDKNDFKNLVDEAHRLGFKLIIDWVANHTGWQHEWTVNKDWYVQDSTGNFTEVHGWDDVIDLNYDNERMQTAMIEAMRYWIGEFDIDGFRCDMAHLVRLDFWHKARKLCEEIKPLFWLGECDTDEYSEVFDVTYAWRWMHATEAFVQDGSKWQDIKNVLLQYYLLPKESRKLYFTSNHDENSWNGTEYEKYGMPLAKNLAVFSCIFNQMPLIYSGQELPNYKRLKFFDKDEIEWGSDPVHTQLESFYKTLLSLRKNNNAYAQDAEFIWIDDNSNQPYIAFFLRNKDSKIVAVFNLSFSQRIKINFSDNNLSGKYYNLFSNISHNLSNDETFEVLQNDFLIYVSE
ncbi:MAG: alpha-amylase family glycosyl hydrolase [Arachidicoccus sp.]|nr:alpha-amylase family glycosyl hydrolase [Arachidicoccus sp.]